MPSALVTLLPPPPKTGEDNLDRWLIKLHQGDTLNGIVIETTATRTVAITDKYIICNRAGVITLTLPDPALAGSRVINVRTWTANAVNSATANVVGGGGGAAAVGILAAAAGKWADLVSDGQNWTVVRNN